MPFTGTGRRPVGFKIHLKLQGYNETMICYVLGIGSPGHAIPAASYAEGYMNNGSILNGNSYYGYVLPMGPPYGGPLFFTQYSFLGLNPHNLHGPYVDYWQQNVNHIADQLGLLCRRSAELCRLYLRLLGTDCQRRE